MGNISQYSMTPAALSLSLCLLLTGTVLSASQSSNRSGRFFFVSTTTSYVSTSTQCFVTDTTLTACAARRRRDIVIDGAEEETDINNISPALPLSAGEEIESGLQEEDSGSHRGARFLLYWGTTTSTTTSFTATSTLASLACTPSGFSLSLCG